MAERAQNRFGISRRRLRAKCVGRVNALLYKSDDAPTFIIMVERSFARDVWQALCSSPQSKR